ncbi:hypothetical protein J0H58_16635 [bacterium]|nr:hypothetical protein [bacterium]
MTGIEEAWSECVAFASRADTTAEEREAFWRRLVARYSMVEVSRLMSAVAFHLADDRPDVAPWPEVPVELLAWWRGLATELPG